MTYTVDIYARQSLDRDRDSLAVTRQLESCREYAAERGWAVRREWVDNSVSATTGKRRADFEAMLDSAPPALLTWHLDRVARVSRDLERVISLGIDVHAVKAGHLDLSNPAGRATARTIVAWATYEGEQKAARQQLSNDQKAKAGLPVRPCRSFGYRDDGMTICESEAAELRWAAEAIIGGATLKYVAEQWAARGVRTVKGNAWPPESIRQIMLRGRIHGLREHRGQIIGTAAWPAILDAETGAAVRATLTSPARRHAGPARRYLLSGIMVCDVCGRPVAGKFRKDRGAVYTCPVGHVLRRVEPVDDYVRDALRGQLADPVSLAQFAAPGDGGARVSELHAELKGIRDRLDRLADAFADGSIDYQALTSGSKRLQARQEAINAELAQSVGTSALASLVTADDAYAEFLAAPLAVQRDAVRVFLRVSLRPAGRALGGVGEAVRLEFHAGPA